MTTNLRGISSMATRQVLAELADAYRLRAGVSVQFESVGGVDAARRVRAAEAFDVVVLAADAIDQLTADGRVVAGSRVDLLRSGVAIAVRAGAPRPDVGSQEALRQALHQARTIGISTGPSGVALARLCERWGLGGDRNRIVQAPPGVPVGALLARGEVDIGFQQLSELMRLPGIEIVGAMPPGCEVVTVFAAGVCAASDQPQAVQALLQFLRSSESDDAKRRHGMEPA